MDKFSDNPRLKDFIKAFLKLNIAEFYKEYLFCLLIKQNHPLIYDPELSKIAPKLVRVSIFAEEYFSEDEFVKIINNPTFIDKLLIPMLSEFNSKYPNDQDIKKVVLNLDKYNLNKIVNHNIIPIYKACFILRLNDIENSKTKIKVIKYFVDKPSIQPSIINYFRKNYVPIKIEDVKTLGFKYVYKLLQINLNFVRPIFDINLEEFKKLALAQVVANSEKAREIINFIEYYKCNFSDACIEAASLFRKLNDMISKMKEKELVEYIYQKTKLTAKEKVILTFLATRIIYNPQLFYKDNSINKKIYEEFTKIFGEEAIHIVNKALSDESVPQ